MSDQPKIPEACTTWNYRLQHLSLNLGRGMRYGRQIGATLCGAEAFDQVEMDAWFARWISKPPKARIANMPPCTECTRKAEKLHG